MKYRLVKKLLAGAMVSSLTLGLAASGPAAALAAEKTEKAETVYVFTDASGNTKETTVSSWIKNPEKKATLKDRTELTEILDVEGDASYTKEDGGLLWETGGEDVYYQGSTDKKAPVSAHFTYYLDGREITPEELAGKSGQVRIRIDYENTAKEGDVYVPFAAVTGLLLDNEKVKNVTVDHGTVLSEGLNTIAVGFGLPGMSENLQDSREKVEELLKDKSGLLKKFRDLEIPDSVEITMDAEDFSLGMCLTMVISDWAELSEETGEEETGIAGALDEVVSALKEAGEKLSDGAKELAKGLKKADTSMPELTDGSHKLADGVKAYTEGADQADAGAAALAGGAKTLSDGAGTLSEGASEAHAGAGELLKGMTALLAGAKDAAGGAKTLQAGAKKAKSGAAELADGVKTYTGAVGQLAGGSKELYAGTKTAGSGAAENLDSMSSGLQIIQEPAAANRKV